MKKLTLGSEKTLLSKKEKPVRSQCPDFQTDGEERAESKQTVLVRSSNNQTDPSALLLPGVK